MESKRSHEASSSRFSAVAKRVSEWAMYLAFFLTPILFLPWTTTVLDINKQIVFVILAAVSLVAWLGAMVSDKKLTFKRGWLNVLPVALLFGVLLSSVFSLSGYLSWVGLGSQEYTSFLSIMMFVLFFYVLMHSADRTETQRKAFLAVLLSLSLASVIVLFGLFDLVHLPFVFAQARSFNTVGSLIGFSQVLSVVMVMGLGAWLVADNGKAPMLSPGKTGLVMRVLIAFVTLAHLVIALALDSWILWIVNIIGVLMLVIFVWLRKSQFPSASRFILPVLILVGSVVFLFAPTVLRVPLPSIVSPGSKMSWDITRQSVTTSLPRFLLGTGPGTFALNYERYKPSEVNLSQGWSLRFDRARSHFLTTLATLGTVGTLLMLALIGVLLFKGLGVLIHERDTEEWKVTYVIFAAWASVVVMWLLYNSNFTLQFLFWGLSGLLAAQVAGTTKQTDFSASPRLGLLASFAFVVLSIATLGAVFVSVNRYSAEIAFAKGVASDQAGKPLVDVIPDIVTATQRNPYSDEYHRNLASALLLRAKELLAQIPADAQPDEQQIGQIQTLVTLAVSEGVRTTDIEPANAQNWAVRGAIYRDVMSFAAGADTLAVEMFQKAAELEPVSPVHATNLGRVYLAISERARTLTNAEDESLAAQAKTDVEENLKKAEDAFNHAIALKPDYAPAHYQLALAFEREGRLEEAAARLGALRQIAQLDVGLGFQYALLLIRLEKFDEAKAELARLLKIDKDYSNAMWFLSAILEQEGDFDGAIQLVSRVAELNPDNTLVQQRLDQLKSGQSAAELPPPVEEGEEKATDVNDGEPTEPAE